jgi:hypothetical protein
MNHVCEFFFPTNHQNVIQFNKIHKTFLQINVHFLKKNIFSHVCHRLPCTNSMYKLEMHVISMFN